MTTGIDAPCSPDHGNVLAASRPRWKGRNVARWSLLLAPWLAGCEQLNPILIDDRIEVWLVMSLVGVALGGGIGVFLSYRRRLKNWNLEESQTAPDPSRDRYVLIGAIVVIVLGFALYNWFSDIGIPPEQQTTNILGWCGGSIVGGVGAYIAGRRVAFRSYRKLLESGNASEEKPLLSEGN